MIVHHHDEPIMDKGGCVRYHHSPLFLDKEMACHCSHPVLDEETVHYQLEGDLDQTPGEEAL
jgi:hypothetical protein